MAKSNMEGLSETYWEMYEEIRNWDERDDGVSSGHWLWDAGYTMSDMAFHGWVGDEGKNEHELYERILQAYNELKKALEAALWDSEEEAEKAKEEAKAKEIEECAKKKPLTWDTLPVEEKWMLVEAQNERLIIDRDELTKRHLEILQNKNARILELEREVKQMKEETDGRVFAYDAVKKAIGDTLFSRIIKDAYEEEEEHS